MITIQNVEVTLEVEGDDAETFERLFAPAVKRWYRETKERERDEAESRRDRALAAPEAR